MGNKKSAPKNYLSEKELLIVEANTNFNREQIVSWHEAFLADCPSGKLDKKVFAKLYKQLLPQDLEIDKYADYVFKAFDTDDSGYIDFTEFLLALNVRARGNLDDRLSFTFNVYDVDNNGYIDKKELKQMLSLLYKMLNIDKKDEKYNLDKRIDLILSKYDISGDRKLSREEFILSVKEDEVLHNLLIEKNIN